MIVKIKDLEFKIKDVNEAGFRRDTYFLVADVYESLNKFPGNYFKGYYDFFFPEKDGVVKSRFEELFNTFLEGDLSKIDYGLNKENSDSLVEAGKQIINFFSPKTASSGSE